MRLNPSESPLGDNDYERIEMLVANPEARSSFGERSFIGLLIWHFTVYGQDKSNYPDGFDAVLAAPQSHKVIFENAFVRVLEVSVSPGTTVPMHHHRWPSSLVSWVPAAGRHMCVITARTAL
jgi:hypothetical protein